MLGNQNRGIMSRVHEKHSCDSKCSKNLEKGEADLAQTRLVEWEGGT